eukprot:136822_1
MSLVEAALKIGKEFIEKFNSYINGESFLNGESCKRFNNYIHQMFSFVTTNSTILNKNKFIQWVQTSNNDPISVKYQNCYKIDFNSFELVSDLNNGNYIITCTVRINTAMFSKLFCENNEIELSDLSIAHRNTLMANRFKISLIVSKNQIRYMICAFYRYMTDLKSYEFDKKIAWYRHDMMNAAYKHKKLYFVSDIYNTLTTTIDMPSAICLLISQFADNLFTYSVENCIFPFCSSYGHYSVLKSNENSQYFENLKDTLDKRFFIVNTNDDGRNYKTFVNDVSGVGGTESSTFLVKQREYKLLDIFDDIVIVGYEEWINDLSFYYYITPIFSINKNKTGDKKNPMLFVHAHVIRPLDEKQVFCKITSNNINSWKQHNVIV